MSEMDIDRLNKEAKRFYDTAFADGHARGVEETTTALAQRHATSLLEIAEKTLQGAVNNLGETAFDIAIARMILGKTPMIAPGVGRALDRLRGWRSDEEPAAADIVKALELVQEAAREIEDRVREHAHG